MKWSVPAKTFLLGEYAAMVGESAILLTTSPCFEVILSDKPGLHGIHPESPAGRWWLKQNHQTVGLQWHDPYQGCGGLGASSAQFLGAYLASTHVKGKVANHQEMFQAYLQSSSGPGLQPSGYDVLAQSGHDCVYLNRQQAAYQIMTWPFKDIGFVLLHTGQKLATHQHLQTITLSRSMNELSVIVDRAKDAFLAADSQVLIDAVNSYHQQLTELNLVAEYSLQHVADFRKQADVLAAKGCGALGADVLFLLVPIKKQQSMRDQLTALGWNILATSDDLYSNSPLIEKIRIKDLKFNAYSV
jgi:mevalonate kinase